MPPVALQALLDALAVGDRWREQGVVVPSSREQLEVGECPADLGCGVLARRAERVKRRSRLPRAGAAAQKQGPEADAVP